MKGTTNLVLINQIYVFVKKLVLLLTKMQIGLMFSSATASLKKT